MLFNSIQFLLFFPLVCLVYFVIPQKIKWIWLLLASYYFYMCWNPKYALLMFASTLITWLSGFFIDRFNRVQPPKKSRALKKLTVAVSFSANLAILFFFKYFDFAVDNINHLLSALNIQLINPSFDVILPVGISFYTGCLPRRNSAREKSFPIHAFCIVLSAACGRTYRTFKKSDSSAPRKAQLQHIEHEKRAFADALGIFSKACYCRPRGNRGEQRV